MLRDAAESDRASRIPFTWGTERPQIHSRKAQWLPGPGEAGKGSSCLMGAELHFGRLESPGDGGGHCTAVGMSSAPLSCAREMALG